MGKKSKKQKLAPMSGANRLELTKGAARWLGIYLSMHNQYISAGQAPIFTTLEDAANASILVGNVLPSVAKLPEEVAADPDGKFEAWAQEPFEPWYVGEDMRATVQRGLKALAERGTLSMHRYTAELIHAFGLAHISVEQG